MAVAAQARPLNVDATIAELKALFGDRVGGQRRIGAGVVRAGGFQQQVENDGPGPGFTRHVDEGRVYPP